MTKLNRNRIVIATYNRLLNNRKKERNKKKLGQKTVDLARC